MNINNKLAGIYAKALFKNSLSSTLESVSKDLALNKFEIAKLTSADQKVIFPTADILGEELLLISSLLISSKQLTEFFKNPTYSEKLKYNFILGLFPGLSLTIKSFLRVLTEKNHLSYIPEVSNAFNKFILRSKKVTVITLISASPINEELGSLLLNALKGLTQSHEVILNVGFNPGLLGGFILEYNSVVIDTSILKEFSLFFNEI